MNQNQGTIVEGYRVVDQALQRQPIESELYGPQQPNRKKPQNTTDSLVDQKLYTMGSPTQIRENKKIFFEREWRSSSVEGSGKKSFGPCKY
jgi:hypothetical protein